MRLVRSALLTAAGIRHGFSTRLGGVSTGRYASLNVGGKWGDDAAAVAENRRRLANDGGFRLERLYSARQVHGRGVAHVDGERAPEALAVEEADALVTGAPGVALAVYTADCVPVLIGDGDGRVAAVHAGWRGTVAEVVVHAVERLVALGAARGRLVAALGPCICARCFEVGDEVAAAFARWPEAVDGSGVKPHVDLRAVNRAQLIAAGITPARVDAEPACTVCERERFFSFRRDGAGIGQQLSFVLA